ncbi:quinone-interacting membrane-bound oxidoreductase complex subunit QmoC [Desulforhopalus singaporensis]|uniref:Putative adenylylsulfate reductase-associated electron transfer protein QmoC n=1 Tax=Desulforhopalus singaporensis TaxID=91360 RepID=A0A1H0RAQ8_9BACT|nr:quinone-interacting membrane-bound oxidoreductase complex subunit QmoC [Desulforhopalus singaporensis]SDP26038.1 putative adenylylsulfate reductase-associated electron transfer protein QmoC [Desulforhopalus singaporensis]
MIVQPDLEFIKSLKEAGGDTLKKCYQCATCSVMCPLSKEGKPFPRKEMIWAQWGMKDQLLNDPDVFLCHQCGDCTANCPRGAKPGDVLSAIRSYAYTFYGWPKPLAKLASSAKGLPMMIGIPVVIIFIMWLLAGATHIPSKEQFANIGYTNFFGHWEFKWYAKNIFFIVLIMVPSLGLGLFSAFMGVKKMWSTMAKQAGVTNSFRPSAVQFTKEFLWPSLVEIIKHNRFNECGTHLDRVRGHLPLMLSFIGLFIVTLWSLLKQDVLGLIWPSLHGPLPLMDPFKLLANVSAIALLFGIVVLWNNRKKAEAELDTQATFYDWFLIWEITAVGVTGLGAELLRWGGMPTLGYIIYFLHLVSVMMLFLYLPYTKLAHLVYRTTAYAFEKYRESQFVKAE